jgi:hypothetical protein
MRSPQLKRVARIVPRAVEQLAEIHVEVAQEGVHAVHVGQRDAQVAPVFLRPLLEAEHLAVAQARAQRLAGLQVFVRHGAHGAQAQFHGEQHVAGAGELAARARCPGGLQQPSAAPRAAIRAKSAGACRSRQSSGRAGPSSARSCPRSRRRPSVRSSPGCVLRKYTSLTMASTGISNMMVCSQGPRTRMSISPLGSAVR